jgi:hypothetical protein
MYRELAAASPDRYRPDFGRSLTNFGIILSELSRPANTLPVTEETVTTRDKTDDCERCLHSA